MIRYIGLTDMDKQSVNGLIGTTEVITGIGLGEWYDSVLIREQIQHLIYTDNEIEVYTNLIYFNLDGTTMYSSGWKYDDIKK